MAICDTGNKALGRIPTPSYLEGNPTKFLDLPLDVLVHIVGLVDALDVLSVRVVCKYLSEISQERAVWYSVFQHLCERQRVIHGSFSVGKWSSSELELACFRPLSFGKRISRNPEGIGPSACHFVDPGLVKIPQAQHDTNHPWADKGFTEALLTSGGRFLLTIFQHHTVSLWDLGKDPNITPPTPVVSFQPEGSNFSENSHKMLRVERGRYSCIAPWGDAFRACLTLKDDNSSENYKAWCYEFQPSITPCYRLIGQLSLNGKILVFDGRRIACCHDDVEIWDIESGRSRRVGSADSLVEVAFKGDLIILFYGLVYKILILRNSAFEDTEDIKLIDSVPYPGTFVEPSNPHTFSICRIPSEYHPIAVCLLMGEGPKSPWGITTGYNLIIYFGHWSTIADSPKLEFRQVLHTVAHAGYIHEQPEVHVVGDSCFLLWHEYSDERLKIFCYSFRDIDPANARHFRETGAGTEILDTKHDIEKIGFCPISARLVTLTEGIIHLMEYCPL